MAFPIARRSKIKTYKTENRSILGSTSRPSQRSRTLHFTFTFNLTYIALAYRWKYTSSRADSSAKAVEELDEVKEIKQAKKTRKITKILVFPIHLTAYFDLTSSVQVLIGTPILKLSTEFYHLIFSNLGGVAALCFALTCHQIYCTHWHLTRSMLSPAEWVTWHQSPTNFMALDISISRSKPRLQQLLKIWIGDKIRFCNAKEKFVRVDVDCTCHGCAKWASTKEEMAI